MTNTHPHAHNTPTPQAALHYVTVNGELIFQGTNGIQALKRFFALARRPETVDIHYHVHKQVPSGEAQNH